MRLEPREHTPWWQKLLAPVAAIAVALLLCSVLIVWAGAPVLDAYAALLSNVHEAYVQQRAAVIAPSIGRHLTSLQEQNLVTTIRLGCSYILHICQMEYELALRLFGQGITSSSFMSQEEILDMNERLICKIFKDVKGVDLPRPFPPAGGAHQSQRAAQL